LPNLASARKVRSVVYRQGEAVEAVIQDIGTIAHRLNAHTDRLDDHDTHLRALPKADSTVWQRLRWLVRGNG
jgi:hypothetical protein